MEVSIKKLVKEAVLPEYAKKGDAGMDLTAINKEYDEHGNVVYGTGLAFEIPEGFVGLIFPRSSNTKKDLILGNSVGVIDSGYRGEVIFKFKPTSCYADYTEKSFDEFKETSDYVTTPQLIPKDGEIEHEQYEVGDRIGQIIIIPRPDIEFIEVEELSSTERGDTGFGSSGA